MSPADIFVYGPDDRIAAVVEVKAAKDTPEWATALRQKMLRELSGVGGEFMIIIGRERSYLWSGRDEPATVLATTDLLGSYLRRINAEAHDVAPEALELIVGIWLSDLTRNDIADQSGPAWLRESGLLDAIRNGRVEFQAAA